MTDFKKVFSEMAEGKRCMSQNDPRGCSGERCSVPRPNPQETQDKMKRLNDRTREKMFKRVTNKASRHFDPDHIGLTGPINSYLSCGFVTQKYRDNYDKINWNR